MANQDAKTLSVEQTNWTCSTCTYSNNADVTNCEMCGLTDSNKTLRQTSSSFSSPLQTESEQSDQQVIEQAQQTSQDQQQNSQDQQTVRDSQGQQNVQSDQHLSEWTCSDCTYPNEQGKHKCEMCGKRNPAT